MTNLLIGVEDLSPLTEAELQSRIEEIRAQMRPLERQLAELRAQRDVLLTEARRRERLAQRETRAAARTAAKSGEAVDVAALIYREDEGSFDDFTFNLKTGGEVRLGFPGSRQQTVTMTDGRQASNAADVKAAHALWEAGWEIGSPGRPGLRVHFPNTRQEKLVDPEEVFARRQ